MSEVEQAHVGTVVAIEGDTAVVRFQRGSMCAHCGACLAIGEKEMETRVGDARGVKVGDRVAVTLSKKSFLTASALAYVLPLAALLIGLFLGYALGGELAAILCGLVLCGLTYVLLHALNARFTKTRSFEPRMTKVVYDESDFAENIPEQSQD